MDGSTRRLMTRLVAVGAGLFPVCSSALGLAEIQVDSHLNQPLRARIEVIDVGVEEWRQIHARIDRETSLGRDAIPSGILGAITLRATEDSQHRHFIEVTSAEAMTEPLFDLPVEIAGSSARVIRNYSILLDPPSADADAPQRLAAPSPAVNPAGAGSVSPAGTPALAGQAMAAEHPSSAAYAANGLDTAAGVIRHQTRHGVRGHHGGRSRRTQQTRPGTRPAAPPKLGPATQAEQDGLKAQLAALQQTLATTQEAVSAQTAEIASLTARAQTPVPPPPVASSHEAATNQAATDLDDAEDTAPETRWGDYFWIGGLGLTIGAIAFAALMWKRSRLTSLPATVGRPALSEPPASFRESVWSEPTDSFRDSPAPEPAAPFSRPAAESPAALPECTALSDPAESLAPPPFDAPAAAASRDRKPSPLQEPLVDTEGLPQEYLEELPAAYIAQMPRPGESELDLDAAPGAYTWKGRSAR